MSLFKPVTLLASTSRSALRATAPAIRRSVFDNAQQRTPSGSAVEAPVVDERVLQGLPHFLPRESFDTIQKWQVALWDKLQAEIRSTPVCRVSDRQADNGASEPSARAAKDKVGCWKV